MNNNHKLNILRITLCITLTVALSASAKAQRFTIGTNAFDWASLGTANIEAGIAVSQNVSLHVGAEINPWTFGEKGNGDKQFQARQISYWAGGRWWPWHVYSGWWVAGEGRYSIYNIGGIFEKNTEEGRAYGGGVYGGYSIMLNAWLNLDFGVGVWGGYKTYTRYACPSCGVIVDEGSKGFAVPDARVALMFIF